MTSRDTSARLRLDSFRKILELEQTKDYQDTAVIGGLDRFLERRSREIDAETGEGEPGALSSITYSGMTVAERREWVGQWLARIRGPDVKVSSQPAGKGSGGEAASSRMPALATNADSGDRPEGTVLSKVPRSAEGKAGPRQKGPSYGRAAGPPGESIDEPVTKLRGVDTKISARLRRLEVHTIKDLLYLLPRRHNDYSNLSKISELVPGQDQTIIATVWEARETALGRRGKLKATEAVLSDETANIKVVWFGQRYLARLLKTNSRVAISGRVEVYKSQKQFQSPEFEILDRNDSLIHTGRLVPVYPLTEGLTPRRIRSLVWQALERWAPGIEEFLPEEIRQRASLVPIREAVMQAHYPDDIPSLDAARRRLAFDELFLLQMAVLMRRRNWEESVTGIPLSADLNIVQHFLGSLPFQLTAAQERCLEQILKDMKRNAPPMNRILQGEVGSGKTVVALAALLVAATAGFQGSIMVPTEILAEQHFGTVSRLLGGLARPVLEENLTTVYIEPFPQPISVGLITGSTRGTLKKELLKRVSEGTLDIVIGTQALIQEGVEIPRLALAVVDEQHRFGVSQRAALRQRGATSPHVLVMSATPIPRTLAMTLYGDLDISTIDQLPPGRQQVRTRRVPPERRDSAYDFVRQEIKKGRQAFVICPLIEESEAVEARAATEEYERLSTEVFPDLNLGLLHGRMAPGDKDHVMRSFHDGKIDVLVSTPVVEVGIDVPNASVMVIEGAHRFGLSQLHQFRGRVGRGEHKSYCLLLADYSTHDAMERLSAVERIHDGFQLAEVDLDLRGPGDYFGTRQSGLPSLRVARLSDHDLFKLAREEAAALLQDDPDLKAPSHQPLTKEVARFLEQVRDEVS